CDSRRRRPTLAYGSTLGAGTAILTATAPGRDVERLPPPVPDDTTPQIPSPVHAPSPRLLLEGPFGYHVAIAVGIKSTGSTAAAAYLGPPDPTGPTGLVRCFV